MTGMLQTRLADNLRKERSGRGLSQERFAHELGVHRTYLGALERGERNLTLTSLETLAKKLGVDPVNLLRE